ncbi:MAG: hypothetical protein U0103_10950 [Candidatus Obscuribacterales bacterium]
MTEKSAIVYIIDGAGGSGFTPLVLKRADRRALRSETFAWGADTCASSTISPMANLLAMKQLTSKYKLQKFNPNRKILSLQKSAGTAVALNALADLPGLCTSSYSDVTCSISISASNSLSKFDATCVVCSAADLLFCMLNIHLRGCRWYQRSERRSRDSPGPVTVMRYQTDTQTPPGHAGAINDEALLPLRHSGNNALFVKKYIDWCCK